MSLFGRDPLLQSSSVVNFWETDLFGISLPSNWPVCDLKGVLNANALEGGIFTAHAHFVSAASTEELRDNWLSPLVKASQADIDAPAQSISFNNWNGWQQEGSQSLFLGWLFSRWWLFVVAYRDPVVVAIVCGVSESSGVSKLKSIFETAVSSLVIAEVVATNETQP